MNPSVFVYDDCIHVRKRIVVGRYAFIVESMFARYALSQPPCDLVDTGIRIGMRSYGFALRKQLSPETKSALSVAALRMNDIGFLEKLDSLCV